MKTTPRLTLRISLFALLFGLALVMGALDATAASATPPDRMSYQGYLVDSTGAALAPSTPANYPVVFRIYDASSGGAILWSEQQTVTVDKGNFSVVLGEGSAVSGEANSALSAVFTGATASDRYIGITVTISGTAMTISPRLRLLPSPYAFAATKAMTLEAQSPSRLSDNRLYLSTGTDANNGLGYSSTFGGVSVGGPALFGASGGVLGSVANATNQTAALLWNSSGSVGIGTGTNTIAARLQVAGGGIRLDGTNTMEFGGGLAKEPVTAGKIGYQTYTTGLDIVGAGTAANGSDRKISLHAQGGLTINGPIANGLQVSGANVIELGNGVAGKDSAAGRIGYQTYSPAALDIVGAGANNSTRAIRLFDRVGIGTSTPRAPLEVAYGVTYAGNLGWYFDGFGSANAGGVAYTYVNNLAAIFFGRVTGGGWDTASDARIKQISARTTGKDSLETIRQLQVTDYTYVDKPSHGPRQRRGLIAQEVEKVLPNAVTQGTEFVPDIFAPATAVSFDSASGELTIELKNAHGLKIDDVVSLIKEDGKKEATVSAVPTPTKFVVKAEKNPGRVFVFGKQVKDFRTVDYDMVFSTGVGAIQELDRQVQALKKSEARVAELEKKVSKMETMEHEVAELRKLVSDLASARGKASVPVAAVSRVEASVASVNQ